MSDPPSVIRVEDTSSVRSLIATIANQVPFFHHIVIFLGLKNFLQFLEEPFRHFYGTLPPTEDGSKREILISLLNLSCENNKHMEEHRLMQSIEQEDQYSILFFMTAKVFNGTINQLTLHVIDCESDFMPPDFDLDTPDADYPVPTIEEIANMLINPEEEVTFPGSSLVLWNFPHGPSNSQVFRAGKIVINSFFNPTIVDFHDTCTKIIKMIVSKKQ